MKRLLFLTLSTLCAVSFAQLPDYVPADGLVGWWPFDEDFSDFSGNDNHCQLFGTIPFEANRYDVEHSALSFNGNGNNFLRVQYNSEAFSFEDGFTVSIWVLSTSSNGDRRAFQMGNTDQYGKGFHMMKRNTYVGWIFQEGGSGDPRFGNWAGNPDITSISIGEWHHVAFSVNFESLEWVGYLDGEVVQTGISSHGFDTNQLPVTFGQILEIGRKSGTSVNAGAWHGLLDEFAIWKRSLSAGEITSLYLGEPPIFGCVDELACNYNPEATADDGSCVFPPTIGLGEDIEACEDSVVLDAGEGFNFYEWSTGEITQTIVVTETGEYAVSASNVIENNHALQFNGTDATGAPAEPILFGTESFSVSVDCKLNAFKGNDSEPYSYIIGHPLTQGTGDHGFKIQTAGTSLNGGFQVHINDEGTTHFNVISFDNGMETNVELDQWYDLTMVVDRNNAQFSFYVDGTLIETQTIHPDFGNVDHPNGMSLGVQSIHGSSLLNGDLDNLQIWDVALSAEEVAHWQTTVPSGSETGLVGYWNFEEGEGDEANDLSQVAPTIALNNVGWSDHTPSAVFDASCAASDTIQVSWLIRGCTDPEACNYVEDASCDDGTCASCEALQTACGPGTIWDAEMQMCIGDGSGDINLDGCVQLNDLLDLLSAYGNCAAEESAWQCGDPLEYQGYDYETVLIGEQCWFAENLRTENYKNGDVIDGNLNDAEWLNATSGAVAVYGEDEVACNDSSPGGDACDQTWSLNEYGRLYNWHSVGDIRGLCPNEWKVPASGDWEKLAESLGGSEYAGLLLKAEGGWENEGGGTNESGFGALPAGTRFNSSGGFNDAGNRAYFWMSGQVTDENAGYRELFAEDPILFDRVGDKNLGFSVRCLKDAE